MADGFADVEEEVEAGAEGKAAGVAIGIERFALDVLHDKVGEAVGGDAAVEEPGDGGVLEAGEDLPFGGEAAAGVIRVEAAADDFEGGGHLELQVGALG